MHKEDTKFPLSFGDTWTERVSLPPNTYLSTWTLIRTKKPYQFVFQQQDGIGAREDGSSEGSKGFTTIAYRFEEVGQGGCLFVRTLTCEPHEGSGFQMICLRFVRGRMGLSGIMMLLGRSRMSSMGRRRRRQEGM